MISNIPRELIELLKGYIGEVQAIWVVIIITFIGWLIKEVYLEKLFPCPVHKELTDESFKKSVGKDLQPIVDHFEQKYDFRKFTGINIHPSKIKSLKELWEKSNGDYDWPDIKNALRKIVFHDGAADVRLTKGDKRANLAIKYLFHVGTVLFALMAILFAIEAFQTQEAMPVIGFFFSFGCIVGNELVSISLRREYLAAVKIIKLLEKSKANQHNIKF